MPQGKEVLLGLNQTGVIVAILGFFFLCGIGAIIPFFIDSMKSDPNVK